MLHDLLSKHLIAVETIVRKLKGVYVERYEEEILTDNYPYTQIDNLQSRC